VITSPNGRARVSVPTYPDRRRERDYARALPSASSGVGEAGMMIVDVA
jgi:hypothetical protein